MLAKWIEKMADGEAIEGVVIGHFNGWGSDDDRERIPADMRTVVLSWEDAKPHLSYTFDNGFGGADCHPVYAWTKSWVIFINEYDGATGPGRIPRNPVPCEPSFGG